MARRAFARRVRRLAASFLIGAGLIAAGALGACRAFAAAAGPAVEYAVKAAYVAKFALFLEWPESAFASPASPVTLCIAGADPFGDTLNRVAEGQSIGDRQLEIKRIPAVTRDSGCHIVFIGGSDTQSVAQGLAAVAGAPVLTVTDSARSPNAAGMIQFVVQNGRVRFTVDDQAAAQSGLSISSHMLSLALSVKPRT